MKQRFEHDFDWAQMPEPQPNDREEVDLCKTMKERSSEGWELVSHTQWVFPDGTVRAGQHVFAIFWKRPVTD